MRVVVTGTPGTGKTTATEALDVPVLHLNDAIREREELTEGHDEERDSIIVDLDAVAAYIGEWEDEQNEDEAEQEDADAETVVVESHLAHQFGADRVVVLRCRPDVLEERLLERGESEASARENRESEALDVVLSEAVETHGPEAVYEIDATDATPVETTAEIEAVLTGEREPSAGEVDFIEYR